MATVEQLMYGDNAASAQPGRSVLARSPGISRDCASEIVRVCEGWGGAPSGIGFRPALLSFPLQTSLNALPGRLFAVVRVADGGTDGPEESPLFTVGDQVEAYVTPELLPSEPSTVMSTPLFHVLVLNEADYAAFGLNPFALSLEGVFLDRWAPGLILERREISPTTLAPLISPLPAESDVGLIEEALRQYLAVGKLILPLAGNDELSDRFLTLLVAALPLRFKRELRFASFTGSEVNDYTLAAVYREGNSFDGWHRLLMSTVGGTLPVHWDEYLGAVKNCLVLGDLLGLEKLSRQSITEMRSATERQPAARPGVLSATITQCAEPVPPVSTPWSGLAPVARATGSGRGPSSRSRRPRRRATRRRPQRRHSGRAGTFIVLGIVLAGAVYWLSQHSWDWMPWRGSGTENEGSGPTLLGVMDVGSLYSSELNKVVRSRSRGQPPQQGGTTAKALTSLRIGAAEDLRQQGRLFVDLVGQGIQQPARPEREAERLGALAQRGGVLEQELHRLLLAYVSLQSGTLWHDLAELPEKKLRARYDSLRRRQPRLVSTVATDLALANLVAETRTARRQAAGLARLVKLFAQPRRDNGWTLAVERAAEALASYRLPLAAAAYRASAFHLARLKRAEEAAEFVRLAYSPDYCERSWMPHTIQESLPAMRTDVSRYGQDVLPPLLPATVAFYSSLDELPAALAQGSPAQLSRLINDLTANQAVGFDAATYASHVDRVRVEALTALLELEHNPFKLPAHYFPAGDREGTLSFLNLLHCQPTPEEWREATQFESLPFFAGWATAAVDAGLAERARSNEEFDAAYRQLMPTVDLLARQAASGLDWTEAYLSLRERIDTCRDRFRGQFVSDSRCRRHLAYLDSLDAALREPLRLEPVMVTVRLAAAVLPEPTSVLLEIHSGEKLLLSTAPFTVGPAAPAGTGWVGTQNLDRVLVVKPTDPLQVNVRQADGGQPLLVVNYGRDSVEVLPGALIRQRSGRQLGHDTRITGQGLGSVVFKLPAADWRQLRIPRPH